MKTLLITFLFFILAVLSFSANAMRTDQLKWSCEDDTEKLICLGYISGATDTLVILNQMSGNKLGFNLCIPPQGISNDQSMAIVLEYIKDNPSIMHQPARTTIIIALTKAFKCKSGAVKNR